MYIGEKIKQLRQKNGLSQEALAEQMHVSRQAVSKWEKGLSFPTTENLLMLAELLNVSTNELVSLQNGTRENPQDGTQEKGIRSKTHLKGIIGAAAVVILLLGLWAGTKFGHTASTDADAHQQGSLHPNQEDTGEFALIWKEKENWEFLSLGEQKDLFPFGKNLTPSATEQVYDTDFGDAWKIHQVSCGALQLEYSRIQDESGERDCVDRIATITPGCETPRGIQVGSDAKDVLEAYDGELVYMLKEQGPDILCKHEYIDVYSPEEACGTAILFYIYEGQVAGISVEKGDDRGNEAFAVDHITVFPIKDGHGDFDGREQPEMEPVDASRAVYIACYALTTDQNLSEEEKYQHRQTIYGNLQFMDWQSYGKLGEAGKEDETVGKLLHWLCERRTLSTGEIKGLLLGACRSNLDGWMAENYSGAMATVFVAYPESFIQCLGDDAFTPEEREGIILTTVYGATVTEESRAEALAAAESLEGVSMFDNIEYDCWQMLLEKLRNWE